MSEEAKRLNINLPSSEMEILDIYSKQVKRNKTDLIGEYIRSLEKKIRKREWLGANARKTATSYQPSLCLRVIFYIFLTQSDERGGHFAVYVAQRESDWAD